MTSGMNLKKECLQSGADAFIQKPFMPDELISLINKSYKSTKTNQK
jgi:CheY-like chemotaxis protein